MPRRIIGAGHLAGKTTTCTRSSSSSRVWRQVVAVFQQRVGAWLIDRGSSSSPRVHVVNISVHFPGWQHRSTAKARLHLPFVLPTFRIDTPNVVSVLERVSAHCTRRLCDRFTASQRWRWTSFGGGMNSPALPPPPPHNNRCRLLLNQTKPHVFPIYNNKTPHDVDCHFLTVQLSEARTE